MRRLAPLALAALLVTAGCLAPTTNDPNPAEPREVIGEDIDVEGANPGVNPNLVFLRVTRLLGVDVEPPPEIYVIGKQEFGNDSDGSFSSSPGEFWEAMGVESRPEGGLEDVDTIEQGFTTSLGQVVLYLGANDTRTVHYVLAHEFVHYVQFANGHDAEIQRATAADTTDGQFVYRSVLEGGAVFATDHYIGRHLGGNGSNTALYDRIAAQLTPGTPSWYRNQRYVLGTQYVYSRVDDPRQLPAVYGNPPRTGEQVIHSIPPGVEPPRALSVAVEEGAFERTRRDRMGEAFLRVALRNGVEERAAVRAATGWGNDTLLQYRPEDGYEQSFAWVVRWDDRANRTEFERTFERYLGARGERDGDAWRVGDWTFDYRSVGADATVVLVGSDRFVRETTVGGSAADVELDLPDSREEPTLGNDTAVAPAD